MGMAASQARYLGLTARKTNCEWEGQQINQARTALANQSADLFNQLLNTSVPDCPDKTDFTKIQYSYSDGFNDSVLENWRQLSDSTNDYNYIVDHYYLADVYTGSKKLMSDPQVTLKNDSNQSLMSTIASDMVTFDEATKSYKYQDTIYEDLTQYKFDAELQNAILDLAEQGYISTNEFGTVDVQTLNSLRGYHDGTSWHFAKVDELEAATKKTLNPGYVDLEKFGITRANISTLDTTTLTSVKNALNQAGISVADEEAARAWLDTNYQDGTFYYDSVSKPATLDQAYSVPDFNDMTTTFTPKFVGNAKLTELGSLSLTDETALAQIIKDCPDSSIANYITLNSDGSIDYSGAGIYTFMWNGAQKYVTYDDLVDSMQTPLFDEKPIEFQYKLPTFEANYVKQEVKETNYALLESDGDGRFRTVKFDDDSTTYTLHCEQISDEDAYDDAMNAYYHDVAEYEKRIADINAQTEIIQQQDRTLELRLKQLDTEQNALQTEMEAVKKVITKNVEMTFKTFSGS